MMKEVFPVDKAIQGLHSPKNATPSFWSLLSKVELAVFRDIKKKGKKTT